MNSAVVGASSNTSHFSHMSVCQVIPHRNCGEAIECCFWRYIIEGFYIHYLLNKCYIYKEQSSVPVMNEKYFLKTMPPYFKTENIIPCCFLLLFLLYYTFTPWVFSYIFLGKWWHGFNLILIMPFLLQITKNCWFEPPCYNSEYIRLFSNSTTYFLHDPEESTISLCLSFHP